jgi:hypothetical protein
MSVLFPPGATGIKVSVRSPVLASKEQAQKAIGEGEG